MRLKLALIIFLASFFTLLASSCFFKEISIGRRNQYSAIKQELKEAYGIDQQMTRHIEAVTLSGSEEWTRMKESPPDKTNVRATLQLNAIVAFMFSLSVTVAGL